MVDKLGILLYLSDDRGPLSFRACLLDNLNRNLERFLMLAACLVCITCSSALDVSNFRLAGDSLYGCPAALGSEVAVARECQRQSITS